MAVIVCIVIVRFSLGLVPVLTPFFFLLYLFLFLLTFFLRVRPGAAFLRRLPRRHPVLCLLAR